MADMLVNLYALPDKTVIAAKMAEMGIRIKRALPPDKYVIIDYIRSSFPEGDAWSGECETALLNHPVSCFIAVKEKQPVGFACYDGTAKGYFGPTGVSEALRGKGIGKVLLFQTLYAMKEYGYGYAIIGWPTKEAVPFYEKTVGAILIENSGHDIYSRMISRE